VERLTEIIGLATDPAIGERLHRLSHDGRVEYLILGPEDMKRHRFRAVTDHGTECAVALPRDQSLANGAVLLLAPDRAIVVRLSAQPWLRLRPRDAAAALELGYAAGNMHWRVRFEGGDLLVARNGERNAYLARLAPLLETGAVRAADDD
jgi:urease accessory protein